MADELNLEAEITSDYVGQMGLTQDQLNELKLIWDHAEAPRRGLARVEGTSDPAFEEWVRNMPDLESYLTGNSSILRKAKDQEISDTVDAFDRREKDRRTRTYQAINEGTTITVDPTVADILDSDYTRPQKILIWFLGLIKESAKDHYLSSVQGRILATKSPRQIVQPLIESLRAELPQQEKEYERRMERQHTFQRSSVDLESQIYELKERAEVAYHERTSIHERIEGLERDRQEYVARKAELDLACKTTEPTDRENFLTYTSERKQVEASLRQSDEQLVRLRASYAALGQDITSYSAEISQRMDDLTSIGEDLTGIRQDLTNYRQYLDSVRRVERQIQSAQARSEDSNGNAINWGKKAGEISRLREVYDTLFGIRDEESLDRLHLDPRIFTIVRPEGSGAHDTLASYHNSVDQDVEQSMNNIASMIAQISGYSN